MMLRRLSELGRDQRGTSIVELGLMASALSGMVICITDLARAYSYKLLLEQAAARTVEKVEQQRSVSTSSYNSTLISEAQAAMADAGYADTTDSHYTADSWVECASSATSTTWTKTADFTTDCTNATDVQARYASIKITESYTPFFPWRHWPNADANGNIVVTGYAEVRMQ
jgi:Flp pilus assembly protein TadG